MGSNTTNISLYKPTVGETGWGTLVNAGFDTLDTLAGATVILQTTSAKFPNAQVLGDLGNGLLKNTTGTGVVSVATTGVDYYGPGGVDVAVGDGGTGTSDVPANGELLIGNGTGYSVSALTAGAGITLTPGAGSLEVAASGAGTAGGADTQLQYNNAGDLAGDTATTDGAGNWALSSITLTTPLALAQGGTGATNAADARTNLGLGTMAVQDANNVAISGGTFTGIQIAIADGGTGASDAGTARTNLGLGSMATQDSTAVSISGGAIAGITDLAVADGGTGTSSVPNNGDVLIGNAGGYVPAQLTAGTNITITPGGGSITIDAPTAGEANTISNLGGGEGVYLQKTGANFELKSLVAGSNISLNASGTEIEIVAAGSLGEANTASVVGTGTGKIFKQKALVDLEFKSIAAGTGISLTNGADDVTIDCTVVGVSRSYTYGLMGA